MISLDIGYLETRPMIEPIRRIRFFKMISIDERKRFVKRMKRLNGNYIGGCIHEFNRQFKMSPINT